MTMRELVDAWEAEERRVAKRTAKTIKTYRATLRNFAAWTPHGLEEYGAEFARWLEELRAPIDEGGRGNKPRSLHAAYCAHRRFANWLVARGYVASDPLPEVELPKLPPPDRELVTDTEVARCIAACDGIANAYRRALATAVMHVYSGCGVRASELIRIRRRDLNMETGAITVYKGKGWKSRTIYLNDDAIAVLRAYLAVRPQVAHEFLFTHATMRLGENGMRALLEQVKRIAGLGGQKHIAPHGLRHSFATRFIETGGDLESLREILGHTDIRTTALYVHANDRRLRAVRNLCTPPRLPDATPPATPPSAAPAPAPDPPAAAPDADHGQRQPGHVTDPRFRPPATPRRAITTGRRRM